MATENVVIITGAAGGIGRATALKFAAEGYRLMLSDLNENGLIAVQAEVLERYSSECLTCPGDLSNSPYLRQLVEQTIRQWNRVDVLVNNAAWRTIETMRTMELVTWEKTLAICLTAPAYLTKWVASEMEQRSIRGVIINVSSVMAGRAGGTSPAYIAAKGGLDSLTHELAVTYGRRGIRVVGVAPGSVETALSNDYEDGEGGNISAQLVGELDAFTPAGRAGKSSEIAEAIYWLSTEAASFITGTTLEIDGGLSHNFSSYTAKKRQFPNEF